MTRSATTRLVVALLVIAGGLSTAAVALSAGVQPDALATAGVAGSPDDDAQRIEFAPGTDSATVQGNLAPGSVDRYVLWAAAGQEISASIDNPDFSSLITVFLGGEVVGAGHSTASAELPANGDYVIEVGNTGSTAEYVLTVQITDASSDNGGGGGAERIEFAPGTDNGTVQGTVGDGVVHRYVLWAAAGQSMLVGIDSIEENADLAVFDPTGNEVVETIDGFALPLNGDYLIEVWSEGGTSTYTMNVQIPGDTSVGTAARIEFAPGTNNGSVSGDIAPATADDYVLWAAAGQTMVVHVSSVTGNIFFSVYAPDGTVLAADQTQSTFTLPAAGDYLVVVETTSSGGPYQLSVWVE